MTTSDLRAYLRRKYEIGAISDETETRVMSEVQDRDREIQVQRLRADKAEFELDRLRLIVANVEEFAKNYDPVYAVEQIRKMLEG